MKELLQLITDLIKEVPELAIWVLLIIFAYKVVIAGSIYGVIRYCVKMLHSVLTIRKTRVEEVDLRVKLDGLLITGELDGLLYQIRRLVGVNTRISSRYIHSSDIEWLREAIDEKLEREKEEAS